MLLVDSLPEVSEQKANRKHKQSPFFHLRNKKEEEEDAFDDDAN